MPMMNTENSQKRAIICGIRYQMPGKVTKEGPFQVTIQPANLQKVTAMNGMSIPVTGCTNHTFRIPMILWGADSGLRKGGLMIPGSGKIMDIPRKFTITAGT